MQPSGLREMSPTDFRRLSEFIYQRWGIHLPFSKKTLLEGRLRKRLHHLNLATFQDYCSYLFSGEGLSREAMEMVDLVTTNKTDFLREPDHFEFLRETVLPELAPPGRPAGHRFLGWSAGCSSGEEPYTLAMVLSEYREIHPTFQFRLLATDISSRMLTTARAAIYPADRIAPVPLDWRRKYLLRSRDPARQVVRFTPEIRERVAFQRLNLMEIQGQVQEQFEVIFCRNVIIYFDRPTQEKVLREFHRRLRAGGFLFLGHSETLTGLDIPLCPVAPTVYRKPA